MNVAVLGLGLIGGSIGLAARERAGARVSGYDESARVLDRALELRAIDEAASDIAAAVANADVVFAATPVLALKETIRLALQAARDDCVISDVGSVKRVLLDVGGLPEGRGASFIGGHPMAGSERGGIAHARADLFDGAEWFLLTGEHGARRTRLVSLIEAFGGKPVEIDATAHDELLARISHLPHIFANLLVDLVANVTAEDAPLPASGRSFKDATRVAGASTTIWADIYLANSDMLLAAIDEAIAGLSDARDALARADRDALEHWNERVNARAKSLLAR